MLRDFALLVFLGSKAYADLELQEDFKGLLAMESGWTTEEETRLWTEFVGSAEEEAAGRQRGGGKLADFGG